MNSRVDYLKLQMPANNGETAPILKERWNKWFEVLKSEGLYIGGHMRFDNVYDGRGNWFCTVDISGYLAFSAFVQLRRDELQYVTRLDHRVELEASVGTAATDEFFNLVRSLNTGNRNVGRGQSRPRAKTDKRDAGGNRVFVGSLKSTRYMALYTKPNEPTAVEVKYSGAPLKALIAAGLRVADELGSNPLHTLFQIIMHLEKAADRYVFDICGMDFYDLNLWAKEREEPSQQYLAEVSKQSIISAWGDLPLEDRKETLRQLQMGLFS